MTVMKNYLISIRDLGPKDIHRIYALTAEAKYHPERFQNALRGKMFGLIFEKPSTRTWVSFETGIFSLGGGAIYLGPDDIKLGKREEIQDVARVLDRYLAGVVLRTFSHHTIVKFKRYFRRVIINGLSDFEHPCQALGDFFTVREKFPKGYTPSISFIGDGNNVLNSLLLLAARLGANFRYATPEGHEPDPGVLRRAMGEARLRGASIKGFKDPEQAVRGSDVVYTDVWVSMGEEKKYATKIHAFSGFQVNRKLLKKTGKKTLVMHCLPAHRGEEITDEVIESRHSIVFDQAENRLHVQKAILLYMCS